ncbi:hypothetical protein [Pantoea sp. MBLJ3]|uniref:hypothetical protein n=1 Tax=Pantoea sp. MBLJ3 TaxID=1562889 RepID=UPI00057E3503|nr:hypothetical protein [Pantoea sp. MBLJ3]
MDKQIFIGETLLVQNEQGASVTLANRQTELYKNPSAPSNVEIPTSEFSEGIYSLVIFLGGAFVSTQLVKIVSPIAAKSNKEQIIEQIRNIDSVISYRLTNNEDAIQQMSINGKSFVYETLDSLMAARKKLLSALSAVVQAEDARNGKGPIKTIKFRFRGPTS